VVRSTLPDIRARLIAEPAHAAVAAMTLIALLLALFRLGDLSLGTDEGVTWALTRPGWADVWTYVVEVEPNFGLHYLTSKAWAMAAGHSELAMRLPSALFYVMSVPVTAAIARRLAGEAAMVVAAVFATVHVTLIEYAQEARPYALVILASASSALLLLRAVEQPSRRRCLAWATSAVIAGYAHMFGAIAVLFQMLATLIRRDAPRRQLIQASAGVALALAPLGILLASSGAARIEWIPELSWPVPRDAMDVLTGRAWPESVLLYALAAGAGLLASRGQGKTLLLAWLAGPAVFALLASLVQPLLVPRYLLVSLPALVILAAIGLTAPRWRPARAACGAALLGVLIAAIPHWYSGSASEDFKGAAEIVADAEPRRDLVITGDGYWALRYYHEGPLIAVQSGKLAPESARELMNASRVWVVRRIVGDPDALTRLGKGGGRTLTASWQLPFLDVLLYSRSSA